MRSRVDLPAPLGPTTPSTSPSATVRETPARIVAAPCALCRSRAIRVPATGAAYEALLDDLVAVRAQAIEPQARPTNKRVSRRGIAITWPSTVVIQSAPWALV